MLTVNLARLLFAFTVSFHILFPAFSIGLAAFLTIFEGLWLLTKNPVYLQICKFWIKVFALTFGMGVVSGIFMEFEFGMNWAGFTHVAGDVLGGLFTYETLFAFFIEAGFIGVMIFGWNKVNPKVHYFSTCIVFLGVCLSALGILSANSWMQTPQGISFDKDHFVVTSWLKVIFNPSMPDRFIHMLLAAFITTLFVVVSVSAYKILKNKDMAIFKPCLSFAFWALLILVPLQGFIGDRVGLVVHQYQPLKTAAIEGVWHTQQGAPLVLFGWPNQTLMKNQWAITIPHGAALINTHQYNGTLIGLDTVKAQDRPYVPFVFFSFRIMVGLALLMLAYVVVALYLRIRGKLFDSPWFLKLCIPTAPIGFIALWTGWITAETGRQPWVVYNLVRTIDAASKLSLGHVLTSLIGVIIVYTVIFGGFYSFYLHKILSHGASDKVDSRQPFNYMHASKDKPKL